MQKGYKIQHDWVGKVVHGKSCKKLKFDKTNKWYMHKPESVMENETHKNQLDFEIQTDPVILIGQPDLVIAQKNRTCRIVALVVPVDDRVKIKESEMEIST